MYDQMLSAEIVEWRRRGRRPFESRRVPRIVQRLRATESTPKEVEEENELGGADEKGGNRNELVQGYERRQIIVGECSVPANIAGKTEIVHGHEDAIHAKERQPEMPLSERFIH